MKEPKNLTDIFTFKDENLKLLLIRYNIFCKKKIGAKINMSPHFWQNEVTVTSFERKYYCRYR